MQATYQTRVSGYGCRDREPGMLRWRRTPGCTDECSGSCLPMFRLEGGQSR